MVSQIAARPPSPPLGPVLTTLSDVDLANPSDLFEYPAKISSCKDVASYNWMNEQEPTILVPGLQLFLPILQYLKKPEKRRRRS